MTLIYAAAFPIRKPDNLFAVRRRGPYPWADVLKTLEPWLWAGGGLASGIALAATALTLPGTEQRLAELAREALAKHPRDFGKVEVAFSGQEAMLTGHVETAETRRRAGKIVQHDLRSLGLNPVSAVWNEIVIDPYLHEAGKVAPAEESGGFVVWKTGPGTIRLGGRVPDEFVKEEVIDAFTEKFSEALIDAGALEIDSAVVFEGGFVHAPPGVDQTGVFLPGQDAKTFPPDASAGEIRAAFPGFSFPPGVLESTLEPSER